MFNEDDAFEMMDKVFGSVTLETLPNLPNFKAMKIVRDALLEYFDRPSANRIAIRLQININQAVFDEYEERVTEQLVEMARCLSDMYLAFSQEFSVNLDDFIEVIAKQMSYSLEF